MKKLHELKTLWTILKNQANCKRSKHRWAVVVEKKEDGTKAESKVCQSCGATE